MENSVNYKHIFMWSSLNICWIEFFLIAIYFSHVQVCWRLLAKRPLAILAPSLTSRRTMPTASCWPAATAPPPPQAATPLARPRLPCWATGSAPAPIRSWTGAWSGRCPPWLRPRADRTRPPAWRGRRVVAGPRLRRPRALPRGSPTNPHQG
jgi:hypothetical protein